MLVIKAAEEEEEVVGVDVVVAVTMTGVAVVATMIAVETVATRGSTTGGGAGRIPEKGDERGEKLVQTICNYLSAPLADLCKGSGCEEFVLVVQLV